MNSHLIYIKALFDFSHGDSIERQFVKIFSSFAGVWICRHQKPKNNTLASLYCVKCGQHNVSVILSWNLKSKKQSIKNCCLEINSIFLKFHARYTIWYLANITHTQWVTLKQLNALACIESNWKSQYSRSSRPSTFHALRPRRNRDPIGCFQLLIPFSFVCQLRLVSQLRQVEPNGARQLDLQAIKISLKSLLLFFLFHCRSTPYSSTFRNLIV